MAQLLFIGFLFTVIAGSLLHFAYEAFGKKMLVGFFSPVNESVWEHLKLLFFPSLFFFLFLFFHNRNSVPNLFPVAAFSILLGSITIISTFYTYVGIIGKHFLIADILTFILGVFVTDLFAFYFLDTSFFSSSIATFFGIFLLFVFLFSFIFFTYFPPKLAIFQDPSTKNLSSSHWSKWINRYKNRILLK